MTDETSTQAKRPSQHQLRSTLLRRANGCCEGSPKHPDCRARDGDEHPDTGKEVILAVIRMDPGTTDPSRMRVMCGRCVLAFDFPRHKSQNWREAREAAGNGELFPIDPNGGKP